MPGASAGADGYYLREFVRRLFNFSVWGRVAQDGINSLPAVLVKGRPDLQRTFAFVDAAQSLLTYTWLFKGIDDYEDAQEGAHIFTGTLDEIAEHGAQACWSAKGQLTRQAFVELYEREDAPLGALRDLLTDAGNPSSSYCPFVVARLAALHALLHAFLLQYPWIPSSAGNDAVEDLLERGLQFAETRSDPRLVLVDIVPRNVNELLAYHNCDWLTVSLPEQLSSDRRHGRPPGGCT